MTDNEIIIEVAKLDGWKPNPIAGGYYPPNLRPETNLNQTWILPEYLTSRDAIIPVIEKLFINANNEKLYSLWTALDEQEENEFFDKSYLFATSRQLCIALLKATGNRKE